MEKEKLYFSLQNPVLGLGAGVAGIVLAIPANGARKCCTTNTATRKSLTFLRMNSSNTPERFHLQQCHLLQGRAALSTCSPGFPAQVGGFIPTWQIGK